MPGPSNRKKAKTLNTKYILDNVELESIHAAKFLGVTIADALLWSKHIDITTKKASKTLGFLKRNIRVHNSPTRQRSWYTLVNFHWARFQFGPVPLASCEKGSDVNSPAAVSFTLLSQTPRRPSYFQISTIAWAMLIYTDGKKLAIIFNGVSHRWSLKH